MTDIPSLLAGWEEARTNLGRKGTLKVIALRVAGQKVADALRELTTPSDGRTSTALELAHDIRFHEPLWYSRGHVAGVLEGLVVSLAACSERETQLREAAERLARLPLPVTSDERVDWLTYQQRLRDVLASSVGVGAVAAEDGKA